MIINSYIGGSGSRTIIEYPVLSGTYTYNGSEQTPTFLNYDSTTSDIGGVYSATNAGEYVATFTPKDGCYWPDGTFTRYSISWTINKAASTITLSSSSGIVRIGKTLTFTITYNGDGTLSTTSSSTSAATVSLSGATATITGVAAGNSTITVAATAGTNYLAPTSKTYAVRCSRLPDGYTEVEYIQGSGAQRIDTAFVGNQDTDVEVKFQYLSSATTSWEAIIGARSSGNDWNAIIIHKADNGYISTQPVTFDKWGYPVTTRVSSIARTSAVSSAHIYSTSGYDCYVDGTSYGSTGGSSTWGTSKSLTLFALNAGNAIGEYAYGKMYYCKIWDNSSLTRNFVPCKNSSSVAGMYDLVNSKFYSSATSTAFVAGPDVD